jgi:hypothetical protein
MSFLTPWFFLGMLAASVPILLHLIKREHARKLEFPTLMFLRRISKKTIRYQKLRHLLLLLLRTLALIFLAMAFTRPFHEIRQAAAMPGRSTTAHIILLDNSLSMAYGDHWDRARQAAASIAREAGPGDKVALLEFSDRVFARTQITDDRASIQRQLDSGVVLTDRPTKYGQALKVAEKLALDAGADKQRIHLISDFQKSAVAAEEHEFRIGAAVGLSVKDVGSDDFSNLTFGDVQVQAAEENSDSGGKIKASVVNFGTEDRKNVPVTLWLDGRNMGEKRVDVAKATAQAIEFPVPAASAGMHQIMLEVEDRNLTRDNRFVLGLETRGKTPVISVENAASGRGGRSPSFFLTPALNNSLLSPYRLTAMTPQKLEASGAFTSGLIIWNNVSGATPGLKKKLEEFVRNGGGLLVVLGDAVTSSEFNRSLGTWLPCKIDESPVRPDQASASARRPADDFSMITDIRMDHPIFRPFSEPHSGSFSSAKFFKHTRLVASPQGEVLARFDNGDPALVTAALDKGRVLILASSADDKWNDLPLRAVYAPFWQEMLRYLDNYQGGKLWVEVGDTIAPQKLVMETSARLGMRNLDWNQAIVVVSPAKERVPLPAGSDTVAVDTAGFYEIRTANMKTPVAVNPVPAESDLTRANAEELAAGWISLESAAPQSIADDERLSPEDQEKRQRFWRFLLLSVLVFLIGEGLLANQFILKPE